MQATYVDFTAGFMDNHVVTVFNRALPPVDYTRFLRPFTSTSWTLVLSTVAVLTIFLMSWGKIDDAQTDGIAHRIVVISGMYMKEYSVPVPKVKL